MLTALMVLVSLLSPLAVQGQPMPGWAVILTVGQQRVWSHATAARLQVPAGQAVDPRLPAGTFGATLVAELPVKQGALLGLRLTARACTATLRVLESDGQLLASVTVGPGQGHADTATLTARSSPLTLELLLADGEPGAGLDLSLLPGSQVDLSACVVPAPFEDELAAARAQMLGAAGDEPTPRVLLLTSRRATSTRLSRAPRRWSCRWWSVRSWGPPARATA